MNVGNVIQVNGVQFSNSLDKKITFENIDFSSYDKLTDVLSNYWYARNFEVSRRVYSCGFMTYNNEFDLESLIENGYKYLVTLFYCPVQLHNPNGVKSIFSHGSNVAFQKRNQSNAGTLGGQTFIVDSTPLKLSDFDVLKTVGITPITLYGTDENVLNKNWFDVYLMEACYDLNYFKEAGAEMFMLSYAYTPEAVNIYYTNSEVIGTQAFTNTCISKLPAYLIKES